MRWSSDLETGDAVQVELEIPAARTARTLAELQKGLDGGNDGVVDFVQRVVVDDVGRQDVDNVAERTEKNFVVEEIVVELGAERGEIAGIVDAKFHGTHGADLACLADLRQGAEMREAFAVDAGDGVNAIEDGFVVEYFQVGVGSGAGQRVPGVGMAVIEGVQAIFAAKR